VVLANKDEMVLLPLNEPTFGTKRKSQIQTYLEQNQGEGVQHMALFTDDIFYTLECMKRVSAWGGFEFMDPPHKDYYTSVRQRLGQHLSEEQYRLIEKYGILADRDQEGTLLQIFTKPIGDRATIFLEIIQV
jgi:4-hydroxyphenylpyruvate dioxygenase